MSDCLKDWKSKYLKFTFAPYLPEGTRRRRFSLELYSYSDGWIKCDEKDYSLTTGRPRNLNERRFKFPRDQSQRCWMKLQDLLELFALARTVINDLSSGLRYLNSGSHSEPIIYGDCFFEVVRRLHDGITNVCSDRDNTPLICTWFTSQPSHLKHRPLLIALKRLNILKEH